MEPQLIGYRFHFDEAANRMAVTAVHPDSVSLELQMDDQEIETITALESNASSDGKASHAAGFRFCSARLQPDPNREVPQ